MINLTDENFKQETSTGKVVVDVWASWCGYVVTESLWL